MDFHKVICGDCMDVMADLGPQHCIFADPHDNLGLKYGLFSDSLRPSDYAHLIDDWVWMFTRKAQIVWLSFNAKWTIPMANTIATRLPHDWEFKPCVQTFTFGQYNPNDLCNNHRPLWRLKHRDAPLYPEQVKVPSWRQENGDKRAAAGGRTPGDVFEFHRVTGNSKQRRKWCPTQLHEGLVERCVLLSTRAGESVCDPFGGTGTTLRVCRRIERRCTIVEMDPDYCSEIAVDNGIKTWADQRRPVLT